MLIGLTGYAQTGKDTVAATLVREWGFLRLAFADGLRKMMEAIDPVVMARIDTAETHPILYSDLLREVGYERAKGNPDVRRLLQRIGTEGVRGVLGDATWRDLVKAQILANPERDIVLTDVRFINEAKMVKDLGGIIVRTVRDGYGRQTGHASETEMEAWVPDLHIEADSLGELHEETVLMLTHAMGIMNERAAMRIQPPPNVYIAAPARDAATAQKAHVAFNKAGLPTFSTWSTRVLPEGEPVERYAHDAQRDVDELTNADVLVILNLGMSAGKASELGMAIAAGKRIILVGPREVFGEKGNIFYSLPQIEQVDSVRDAILRLGGLPMDMVADPHIEGLQEVIDATPEGMTVGYHVKTELVHFDPNGPKDDLLRGIELVTREDLEQVAILDNKEGEK